MKRALFALLPALLLLLSNFTFAQPGKRLLARRAIRKTATVIIYTQKQVKENKVYTGNLARAVRHQRYARFLFRQGKYGRAVHHTRRARRLAFLAIQANKGAVQADWQPTTEENANPASDTDLDKELPKDNENLTDEQVILQELNDIDLEDAVNEKNPK